MKKGSKKQKVLDGLTVCFLALSITFILDSWGITPPPRSEVRLVDPEFTQPATVRNSLNDLIALEEDVSYFDCYACHQEDAELELEYDDQQDVVLPEDHQWIAPMQHGKHHRNDNCFNCHNENDLTLLQTRDARTLSLKESSKLCGSCHGPTYQDWEAGVHGRVYGYWATDLGEKHHKDCVSCHEPHHPKFPTMEAAPGPNALVEPPSEQESSNDD